MSDTLPLPAGKPGSDESKRLADTLAEQAIEQMMWHPTGTLSPNEALDRFNALLAKATWQLFQLGVVVGQSNTARPRRPWKK